LLESDSSLLSSSLFLLAWKVIVRPEKLLCGGKETTTKHDRGDDKKVKRNQ